jgi:DNA-binding MarR family transcriptional regulator
VTAIQGANAIPPRERWPEPLPHTEEGRLLTEAIVTTFRLNGRLLEVAQELAAEGGITAAWWQVLGGILDQPRTVAEIGRRMGMTRQAVQRVADILVERGLAEYRPNPNHRRANLLACTEAGYWAIRRIALVQHPWANSVGAKVGADALQHTLTTMQRLLAALEETAADEERPLHGRRVRRPTSARA